MNYFNLAQYNPEIDKITNYFCDKMNNCLDSTCEIIVFGLIGITVIGTFSFGLTRLLQKHNHQ